MPPPSSEPVHKGTLVCVVLKARNLPNKKSIGKQDPYTVLTMGTEQQKTKPDKRGGQHPTWDEQLHFEIYEDMEDALAKASNTGSGSAAKSAASSATDKAKGGKKVLKVACYADDSKEPEFIGDGIVDLTDTLKTGEFDEWVTIKAKDRYAGEVYLELTFYSSAAPPKKRKPTSKPVLSGSDTYGGAGTFQRIDDLADPAAPPKPPKGKTDHPPIPASMRPGGGAGGAAASAANSHGRMSSSMSTSSLASSLHRPAGSLSHSQTMHDLGAGTIRPSSSLANLDAYTPAYAPASISRSTSPVPPSSAYHSAAPSHASHASHASHSSSIGPAAGSSRRNSFAAPPPSEFGHSITPSASYYAQHSMTPSQSSHHHLAAAQPSEAGDDRYATIRPGAVVQQHQVQPHHHAQYTMPRSHSISHVPAYAQMPQPDYGADQLAHTMGQMSFHAPPAPAGTDKPLPPPTPVQQEERPPQSHIYPTPAHLASLYTPPSTLGYAAQHEVHQGSQRPVSPAARPASALSQYSTSPAAQHAPSVVNAQAYYQQQASQQPQPQPQQHQQQQQQQQPQVGAFLSQPQSVPPRAASPGIQQGYTPIPSPYSQPPAPQHHQQPPPPPQPQSAPPQPQQQPPSGHVSRPLPSTQSSTSLASQAVPPPHAYSHLYQAVQQPSPPPAHAHSYSQSTWTGPPPPQSQPAYSAPSTGGGVPASTSGYLYTKEGWAPQRSPSPLPPIPQNYTAAAPYPPTSAGYAYANQPQYSQYPQYQQQPQYAAMHTSTSSGTVYQPNQYHH